MNITFKPLNEIDFPLLLKWLEVPHIKKWWDRDVTYTLDQVEQKYYSYTKRYKILDDIKKPINAYIMSINNKSFGYIQLYDAQDFINQQLLKDLPEI